MIHFRKYDKRMIWRLLVPGLSLFNSRLPDGEPLLTVRTRLNIGRKREKDRVRVSESLGNTVTGVPQRALCPYDNSGLRERADCY